MTEATAADLANPPKISLFTKIAHGFGASGFGVKDNGFNYFLLLFYSQVVGMDARLVGLALFISLVLDAFSDPLVGYWSDNARTKWGRRHPFMYASILPITISYLLLWNPPDGWSDQALFWYILILAIFIRTALTFYETPSTALTPELSTDYDERSSLSSYRLYFAWTIGNLMTVLMFFFLFPAFSTAEIPDGRFNEQSYRIYGIVASGLIFLSILFSSLGTHKRIPYLKAAPPKRQISVFTIFREIFETLSNKSFLALFAGAMFGAVATGLAAALSFYFLVYFWGFSTFQQGLITLGTFVSAGIGFVLAPYITKKLGKKKGAIIVGFTAFVGAPLPIFLRLVGLLPENGDPLLFWIVLISKVIDVGLIICYQTLFVSMLADLVEQSELQTGRRSEGVFSAASTFIRKMVQGIGVTLATMILTLANFPKGANTSEVPQEAITSLGAWYVPIVLAIWMLMILCIAQYKVTRESHAENLRKLEEIRANKAAEEAASRAAGPTGEALPMSEAGPAVDTVKPRPT